MKDDEIKEKFDKCGKVIDINIIKEPHSKENRGFGFITFDSPKAAQKAMAAIPVIKYFFITLKILMLLILVLKKILIRLLRNLVAKIHHYFIYYNSFVVK